MRKNQERIERGAVGMAYTIVDLLDKFISLEQAGQDMFMGITGRKDVQHKIKTMAKIFANQEKKHIEIYQTLKAKLEKEPETEIDFFIYDKISAAIFQYAGISRVVETESPKSLLEFCLNFEKDNLALLLSIQDIFSKAETDTNAVNIKLISEIISEEQKHVKNLEAFM